LGSGSGYAYISPIPTQLAAALADGALTVRQVTVVDWQSVLNDWEEGAKG